MARERDTLRIHLLGGFSLAYDGEQLPPLPSRHARLLFAWLALQSGRPQSRTLLADRFWPDLPEARGRRRLSHALWQIQDSFGELAAERPYVITRGDEVAYDVHAPSWLDVEEFEQRLDGVDRTGEVDADGMRQLRRALQLYGGDLLAGSYEPWVIQEQERLRQRYVSALQRLAVACEQRANFEEALAVARRLTHEAPLREDAHRSVMRLCVLVGQPSQALEQFERCRSVLAEELGASPSAETVALHDSIAHRRTIAPTTRTPAPTVLETRALVGRDDERVRLVDQLEHTIAGGAGTVFLEGEPGVGKTHLLARLTEDARWRGFTVVWGACGERAAPFHWLREALATVLDRVRTTQLEAVVAPVWMREAAVLLPALRGSGDVGTPQRPLGGADAAERMRQALTHVITGLATIDPLVLVLEDVHRADEDTLALLRTLTRHPSPGRLLLVLSFRDVEARADESVWAALRAIDRDALPVRVALRPMGAFGTRALLREALGTRHVPAAFVERVHRETGGNPLYVLELLRSLRDAGDLADGAEEHLDTLAVPVTSGVRTLIGTRLDLLDDDTTAVVEQAAVLGPEFQLAVLAEASDVSPRARTVALGELVRRNLLQVEEDEARFTHAATRTVLLDGLTAARGRVLHARAAAAVAARAPEDVESLAAHLLVASPGRAVGPLREAAERALAVHAYGRAADHLLTAVGVAATQPMAIGDRIQLLLATEAVLDVLGRRDEQATILDELVTLRTDDPALRVEIAIRRATHLGHVDRIAEAVDVARAAVASTPDDRPLLRGRSLTAVGHLHGWAGDHARAVEVLEEAAALVAEDPVAAAHAQHALGASLRLLQRFDEAGTALRAARAAAARADDDAAMVKVLGGLADVLAETGSTAEAASLQERAVAVARRIGFRYREGVSLVNLATIRLMRGEPVPALAAYDEAGEVFAGLGNERGAAIVRLNRAWLRHRWLGDDRAAEDDAGAARDHLGRIGDTGSVAVVMETLAGIARRRRDLHEAERLLRTGLAAAEDAGDRRAAVQLQRGFAELALVAGDDDELLARTGRALADARATDLPEFAADLHSLAALGAIRSGDTAAAGRHATVAGARLGTSAEPHRVHHRLGLVAEALGRPGRASEHHRRATELLERALAGLDDAERRTAVTLVREHASIRDLSAAHAPRTVELRLARADAPRGRALEPAETVSVALELPPPPADPATRRSQLLALLDQVSHAGAEATVDDLSTALDVSASTVRRDLRALRHDGHRAATRGSGTG